ncbi:hypothetical protein Oter_0016 [Opitutus terrae PB90-1]|uniref:Sodium/calcium exchanger membrane region domain-containing protein n=2 Tax=Opitutus terrae TaxID=107709 RepID=B1ZWI4_OPITP|nr:hypothetical protein Oter_0016 [Opitutus terrae PB90-1]
MELIEALDLTSVWTYLALFLAASLLMIWRLEALLSHGLEGTALGTLVMPYCSGLGNLIFVAIIAARGGPAQEVLTNSLVNNVTNLTLVLALPTLAWGLSLRGGATRKKTTDTTEQLNRLSLLLSLGAVLFFTGVTWALGEDGRISRSDGLVLIGVFLFWQCFQVFDVLRQNVRQRRSFGAAFYVDLGLVLIGAYALYVSIEWLVAWLSARPAGWVSAQHLGWLSGWLMVLPNALIAFYYAARRRADIAFASQIGDGHICIPLCVGLIALVQPFAVPRFFATGLVILAAAAIVHGICLMVSGGLPRWLGWPLLAGYAVFVAQGLGAA